MALACESDEVRLKCVDLFPASILYISWSWMSGWNSERLVASWGRHHFTMILLVASGVEGMGSEPGVGKDGKSSRAVTLGVPLNNKSNLDPLQRSIGPPQPHQSRWPLRGDAG